MQEKSFVSRARQSSLEQKHVPKTGKLINFIKIKIFALQKSIKDEKQATDRKKNIFIPLIKGLVSRIYKELSKVSEKKQSIQKPAKDAKRHLTKKNIHMGNKHMNTRSILLAIREI